MTICEQHAQERGFRAREIEDLEEQRNKLFLDRSEISERFNLNEKGVLVVEELIRRVSEQDLNVLAGMIDWGLRLVFDDRGYCVRITAKRERGNPSVDFNLVRNIHGKEVVSDIWDDVGGGIKAVVALVIQVFYIKFTGLKRVIFLDEALSAVSDQYVDGLFDLLKALNARMGFKFLLITHDERFLRMVDRHYVVQNGNYRLQGR